MDLQKMKLGDLLESGAEVKRLMVLETGTAGVTVIGPLGAELIEGSAVYDPVTGILRIENKDVAYEDDSPLLDNELEVVILPTRRK